MKKKNVLGHDPLGWMKVEREKKLVLPEGVKEENKTAAKDSQQEVQDSVEQQSLPPRKDEGEISVVGDNQTERVFNVITGSNEPPPPPKPKVVIGRLYEEISKKTANAGQHQGVAVPVNASNRVLKAEQPFPSHETGKTDMGIQSGTIKLPGAEPRIQFSTYLIVAYTVLLLILGYFVYTDFSKRTSRLEAKIYALERALRLR
ncbi:MAG: hypothetical protein FJ264_09900 [Planctomycetes bacterium]|nr:hypothetical protein [Planctomycetota bacterium]